MSNMTSTHYIPRAIESSIQKAHRSFKVLFLGGPRQVGKTTLLKHLTHEAGMHYVTLDSESDRMLAKSDPKLFLQRHKTPLLIDEVQYAPELFSEIKVIVDASEKTGQFWLTGSQQFSVLKGVQETLAGRIAILDLLGLSARELDGDLRREPFSVARISENTKVTPPNIHTLYSRIFQGFFPVFTHSNAPDRDQFYNAYLQTYIDRDIAALFGVEKTAEFHTFMRACAARTAQVLNIADLARDADISPVTAKEWLSLLYGSGHLLSLPAYHSNHTKRETKAPKIHFLDTGLAAYLLRYPSAEVLEASALTGNFFESYVVGEIYKGYINAGKHPLMYHYRDREKREVDLVLEDARGLELIECKRSTKWNPHDDFKHMRYLSEKMPVVSASAVSLIEKPILRDGENYVPYTVL